MAGGIMCVGRYLAGKVEQTSVRASEAGGPRRTAYVLRETIITDTDPVVITQWAKDGFDPNKWSFACKKDDKCLVRITGMTMQNGIAVLRGTVEPLV